MPLLNPSLLVLSCVFSAVSAAPKSATTSPYGCTTFTVPIPVTNVTTIVPPFPYPFPNGYAATAFDLYATNPPPTSGKPKLASVTKTFNISVEYCTPITAGPKASTVQLLTHGLGFDKTYWDFHLTNSTNATYSYINSALTAGYSTLSWDRLGCGASTVADPFTEIQATVELKILAELTGLLRQGQLSSRIPRPSKILHVGHSWGSQLTNALAASAPTLSDGLVLTGYSHNFSYQPLFLASTNFHLASTNQPCRFSNRSSGYLTWGDAFGQQYSFFYYPNFEPAVLNQAEATKWPFTAGEFISQTAISYEAPHFTGPVLYLAAQHDLIYCGGNCDDGSILGPKSPAVTSFNASRSVDIYIQPNTGHGISLHKNATAAFGVVMDWAGKNGF